MNTQPLTPSLLPPSQIPPLGTSGQLGLTQSEAPSVAPTNIQKQNLFYLGKFEVSTSSVPGTTLFDLNPLDIENLGIHPDQIGNAQRTFWSFDDVVLVFLPVKLESSECRIMVRWQYGNKIIRSANNSDRPWYKQEVLVNGISPIIVTIPSWLNNQPLFNYHDNSIAHNKFIVYVKVDLITNYVITPLHPPKFNILTYIYFNNEKSEGSFIPPLIQPIYFKNKNWCPYVQDKMNYIIPVLPTE